MPWSWSCTCRALGPLHAPCISPAMWLAILLALCCLTSDTHGARPPDFCSKDLISSVKPGFPKTIETNNPGVLKAARHSVEKFNNCTNDIFLFKESHVSKALVQVVKGLKYMLEVKIGRTTCRKTMHHQLDNCDFQTNPALKRTLYCYSEVWVIPWLHSFEERDFPTETVKFGPERMYIDSWVKKHTYDTFKEVLGSGMQYHLQTNEFLRNVFELGPPVMLDAATLKTMKISRFERHLYNSAAFKARTKARSKCRDKRADVGEFL